ncbi:GNAT family N-acetyltransferase [Parabacteroides sp. OttesenSCG-928-G07]|nr:GNAT family N-acetyltransferase [Parabacteroides sp. OttesenSCG-928-G07]
MDIERVNLNDISRLQDIGIQTFSETFSAENTAENMTKYLHEKFSIEQLTTELNNKESEFYFDIHDKHIAGYLKVNFGQAQTELKEDNALEIERIYVLQEYQGKKVGQLLYEKAIQIAQHIHVDYIWLGVWEENTKAISFYRKNGFIEFDKHIFNLGNDEQTDLMMKRVLK